MRIRNFSPRYRRSDVIERFLDYLNQEGGNQTLFQYLVPFGSEATLEKHLPDLLDDFSLLDWTHLSKCHPEVAKRTLYGMIEKSEIGDVLLQRTLTHVFTQWISHDRTIKFALDLVKKSLPKFPLNIFPVGWSGSRFLKRSPGQAVDLILNAQDDISESIFVYQTAQLYRKLSLSQFLALMQRYPSLLRGPLFPDLSTEQKLPAYELIRVAWRDENGVLQWDVTGYLPEKRGLRRREDI